MLDIIGAFTFKEKITLLAWNAAFYAQASMEQIGTNADLASELVQAQKATALISGLCTGKTSDQEILDFMEWADYAAQLEFVLDCRTEQEVLDMVDTDPCMVAAFQLCVRLGLLDAWEPW